MSREGCLITFERNRFSVPASFANRAVSLRVYPERLVIVAEGQTVCTHERIIDRSHRKPGKVIYDWCHYLAVIQRKPGALRNGAPFTEMPEASAMRHDPAGASIFIMLHSLKLHGMAHAVDDQVAQGALAFEAATPMLFQMLKAEMAEREVRSIAYHTKVARFPSYEVLTGFDFASSDINEATVRQLHRSEFIENAENVVLIGRPGTRKSHVATAIGVQAIEHHRRKVRFYSTVELVSALEQEKAIGKAGKPLGTSLRDTLPVNEWLRRSQRSTSSSSTSLVTCRSARPVAHCCSTF